MEWDEELKDTLKKICSIFMASLEGGRDRKVSGCGCLRESSLPAWPLARSPPAEASPIAFYGGAALSPFLSPTSCAQAQTAIRPELQEDQASPTRLCLAVAHSLSRWLRDRNLLLPSRLL